MPKGIYKRTNKHLEQLKYARSFITEEILKKMSLIHKGKKIPPEQRKKMSLSHLGLLKGIPKSEEHKKKLSLANIGHKNSEESKIKSRERMKGNKYAVGYKHTEEHKRKVSLALRGEKSYLWQGGISYEPYSVDWTRTLKRAIRERQHYICGMCGLPQEDKSLDVHHIDYNKKNCNPNNLVALHHRCHTKTNNNREYWKQFFKVKQ